MADALLGALGALLVASLATVIVYVLWFLSVALFTTVRRRRRETLAEELDRVLAEVLAGATTAPAGRHPGSGGHPRS